MTSAQVCILISIAVYLIAMLAIGIVCSKRNNTVDDFYLGGRRLGPVVTAMSAEASDMSSWLLMGLPGVAYLTGIADPGWTAIGLGVGTYINWLVVARRLRRYSARIGAITVPDFFSRRFGEKKHILTAMAAILIIVFFVPYTASGFAALRQAVWHAVRYGLSCGNDHFRHCDRGLYRYRRVYCRVYH